LHNNSLLLPVIETTPNELIAHAKYDPAGYWDHILRTIRASSHKPILETISEYVNVLDILPDMAV